ncbi:hypothetical protein [Methylobacterium sp. sgz302541]|uniref:hypothetical protein n=1 Tax=unclassified Methylobacterium TaxID=2615210 RepID=UPI003D3340C3
MRQNDKPSVREIVAACIAWPSIALTVISFFAMFIYPEHARWFLGVGISGMGTAVGISSAPAKRYFATALLLWLRPWLRKAQNYLQRKS